MYKALETLTRDQVINELCEILVDSWNDSSHKDMLEVAKHGLNGYNECSDHDLIEAYDELTEHDIVILDKDKIKPDHESRMQYAHMLADANEYAMQEFGESSNGIGFDYFGTWIHDPFYEDTGRFEVDPVEYYGNLFLDSKFYNPVSK